MLALQVIGVAQAADKNKIVRITNQQGTPAEVYINFAADSVLKPTDLPFCRVTGRSTANSPWPPTARRRSRIRRPSISTWPWPSMLK
jgi:hypothetical protein